MKFNHGIGKNDLEIKNILMGLFQIRYIQKIKYVGLTCSVLS